MLYCGCLNTSYLNFQRRSYTCAAVWGRALQRKTIPNDNISLLFFCITLCIAEECHNTRLKSWFSPSLNSINNTPVWSQNTVAINLLLQNMCLNCAQSALGLSMLPLFGLLFHLEIFILHPCFICYDFVQKTHSFLVIAMQKFKGCDHLVSLMVVS